MIQPSPSLTSASLGTIVAWRGLEGARVTVAVMPVRTRPPPDGTLIFTGKVRAAGSASGTITETLPVDRRPQGDAARFEGLLFEAGAIELFVADQLALEKGLSAPVARLRRAQSRFRLDDVGLESYLARVKRGSIELG